MTDTHPTLKKFGYPASLIKDYDHWAVVLRPRQITLGSLVMISKSSETDFSALPSSAFTEMAQVIKDIENALKSFIRYDKINYLTLMMVDPQVHSHVIPRYEGERTFEETRFKDTSWPGPPDLGAVTDCNDNTLKKIREELQTLWP